MMSLSQLNLDVAIHILVFVQTYLTDFYSRNSLDPHCLLAQHWIG